jgi:dTDP-4-dehydrorhamnose reductase
MILVTGANGFVGHKIMQMRKDAVACPSLRGASEDEIKRIVETSGADTIIHTAAISDIGACQADPEASYLANVQIPVYMAKAAKGQKLICFSSDQVYSGTDEEGPYSEDMVKPNNIYSAHKLEMERSVLDIEPTAVMLRAEWMYDYYLTKTNYFMNIINAKDMVCFCANQFRGITYVKEVVENMEKVMHLPGGVYNFGSETTKSMFEITKEFVGMLGKDIRVEDDSSFKHNLWMNCEKAQKYGVIFSSVEDGLIKCAKDYGLLV